MRTLDANLLTAQQGKSLDVAIKITLSLAGVDDVVLERDRIRKLNHIEEPYRNNAKEAEFDNSDGFFTEKALQGYKAVISWGLGTKAGKKYSDTAPLWVTWQQLNSVPGRLSCLLTMLGIPDLMDEDEASESYIPDETDTKTVKTLINEIAGATLACYSHCQAYEVVWEAGYDTLADTYKPKDSFRIYIGGSRLAAIKRLMEYTGNVLRYSVDGKIHILKPVTTGTDYDYQYSLENGHTFFSKAYRKTLVLPNYIVVRSQKDDTPQYSGDAAVDDYDDLPDAVKKHKYIQTRLQSNAEATSIAEAILSRYQLNAEMGSAEVPLNCGAELFDYDKVTDEREKDYRVGNIGSLSRTYNAEKRIWNMRFTFGDPPIVQHIKELYQSIKKAAERDGASFERLYAKDGYIESLWIDQIKALWIDPDGNIDLSKIGDTLDSLPDGEVYARVKSLHIEAGIIKLDEHILYSSGYDPTEKMPGDAVLDDIPDGTTYQRTRSAALTAAGLVILDQVVVGTYGLVKSAYISAGRILLEEVKGDIDDLDEGSIYGKVRKTDISAGHIKLTVDQDLDEQGIEIVSSSGSTRIRINDNRIGGYKAGVLQFELRASDGRAYAGAGKVILDDDGITIKGEKLIFKTAGGASTGSIYKESGYDLVIDPGTYNVKVYGHLLPYSGDIHCLGLETKRWGAVYAKYFRPPTTGGFIFRTSARAEEGSIKIVGGGSGDIKIYSNGAWRVNT